MTTPDIADLVAGPRPPAADAVAVDHGRLSFEIEADGGLRYVHLDGLEVIRRLYVGVRDVGWDTLPGYVTDAELKRNGDSLTYTFTSSHSGHGIEYVWHGRVAASADGTIAYEMDGRASVGFDYARIGLLLLSPTGFAGRPYRVRTPAGLHASLFPQTEIGPQVYVDGEYYPLLPAFSELSVFVPSGELRFELEGDLFEVEDQRNWTDDSFKTYSTPMSLGMRRAEAGGSISQRLVMTPPPPAGREAPTRDRGGDDVTLRLAEPSGLRLPAIGLAHTFRDRPLSPRETTILRDLGPAHLRVDLAAGGPELAHELAAAAAMAEALDCGLELAVHLSTGAERAQIAAIAQGLPGLPVRRVLLLHAGELVTAAGWTRELRARLTTATPVYGGTDLHFAEVNRERPDPAAADGVAFSITPQVHAFDDRSLMETLSVQGAVIRSARSTFARGLPLAVSPVTLRMRFNPDAVADTEPGAVPPDAVDPRQSSLFCAAWSVGSLKYLAEAGVESVTYFGTVGWEGVIERDEGSLLPQAFPSIPAGVYPCYHALRALMGGPGAQVIPIASSASRRVVALGVVSGSELTVVIANLTAAPQRVRIDGAGPRARTARLDATTLVEAMTDPARFGAAPEMIDLSHPLELLPYSVWVVRGARLSGS
jgi:D-apionolactonase